jgi:hypothetical protein
MTWRFDYKSCRYKIWSQFKRVVFREMQFYCNTKLHPEYGKVLLLGKDSLKKEKEYYTILSKKFDWSKILYCVSQMR